MKNLKLILTATILTTLIGCVNGDDYGTPDLNDCSNLVANKQVTDLSTTATSSSQAYVGADDDIIEAYVTSSDEGGNFYKSISLVSVDGTTGFSMPIDAYNIYTKFEPGRKVYIYLKNLYYVRENSSTVLGSLYNGNTPDDPSDDEVGRISQVIYQDVIKRSCDKVEEADILNSFTVAQALNNNNLNKLIELNNVQFTDASLGKTYFDASVNNFGGATNHTMTDDLGNTITFRVSEYANFAGNAIPSGSGKVRGVLTKFGSTFQFLARTESDIQLTNPRLDIDFFPPIVGSSIVYNGTLNEPFTSYATNASNFPAYVNDAAEGGRYWEVKSFSSNKYIQMSSFGGGNTDTNKTLFIVPVNMTAANTLSFQTKTGFNNGATLKVFYTTNYVPGNAISTATLVDITSSFAIDNGPATGYSTNFLNSGTYNIPAGITGNGFFVFQYLGNGLTGPTTTMQIDNIVIN